MTVEVKFEATIGLCTNYMEGPDASKEEVSVIVAPLKAAVNGKENGKEGDRITVSHGCNLWKSCHNKDCWYSLAGRENKKALPKE